MWKKSESVNHHYLTESANVLISKCPWRVSKWQGWLKLANVWVSKCLGPVRCLFSQQMSGLQMLNWHMSGQRLNFPAFELFDETFSKFIFSWKSRLKTWRVSPLQTTFITAFLQTEISQKKLIFYNKSFRGDRFKGPKDQKSPASRIAQYQYSGFIKWMANSPFVGYSL